MTDPENKRKKQDPTPNEQLVEDLSWDIPGFRALKNFFIREGKTVKNGWLAFVLFSGVSIWIGIRIGTFELDSKITEMQKQDNITIEQLNGKISRLNDSITALNINAQSNGAENERLRGEIFNKNSELSKVTNEKDSALQRVSYLEALPANAAMMYSNVMTAGDKEKSERPNMIMAVNGQMVESNAIIQVTKQAAGVQFVLVNVGRQTGLGVVLQLSCPLDKTNISGWPLTGMLLYNDKFWDTRSIMYGNTFPSGHMHLSPVLNFSTNLYGSTFPAFVSVYGDNLEAESFPITLKYQ